MKKGLGPTALLSLVALLGCAPKLVVTGVAVYEEHWFATVDSLRERASQDLGCPADQLEWSLFSRHGQLPREVGVNGCGREVTYVGSYQAGWVDQSVLLAGTAGAMSSEVIVVDGIEIYARIWADTLAAVLPMAERDLQCPPAQIRVSLQRKVVREPIDVVATGCGRSLLYIRRTVGNNMLGHWQARGVPTAAGTGSSGPAPAPAAPIAPR